ncbi:cytochrome P450 [Pseudomonas citronellolis]|uniref:cytochrome P450 n=1 Tax=Pseudomonas citronellolis TaxID=53408 RepID=UPI0021C08DE1|nr:cytochrome P450 [Pseudomonas citronellolis]UXJ50145.1 cytochrome P450 [Pseudomonas citronellolis]
MTASYVVPSHVPQHLVVDFDYFNFAEGSDDLHLAWKKLHDGPDIFWTPRNGGHWVVTRADDINEVFKDYECFTSSMTNSIPVEKRPFPFPPVHFDPPQHTDYRNLLIPSFVPKAVSDLERKARQLTVDLIESFIDRGECEFYGDFALQMPIGIFLGLVDLPDTDRPYLLELADIVVRSDDVSEVQKAYGKTWAYLGEVIAKRVAQPGVDLISTLVQADFGGRKLTQEELLGFGSVALFGGLDTVAATLGFVVNFLANNPGHRQKLIDNPALIPTAIEELLRRFPVANLGRTVAKDLDFKGVCMKEGDPIQAPAVLANLDDRRFPDPLSVDFTRKDVIKHLTFGAGAHRCIGSFLARTELKVFLEEWLKRIPQFTITPNKQPVFKCGKVMAVINLPLSWAR